MNVYITFSAQDVEGAKLMAKNTLYCTFYYIKKYFWQNSN